MNFRVPHTQQGRERMKRRWLSWNRRGRRAPFAGAAEKAVAGRSMRKALSEHLKSIHEKHRAFDVTFEGYTSTIAAKSASQARYLQWLNISDVASDLTFIAFCRGSTVRRAA